MKLLSTLSSLVALPILALLLVFNLRRLVFLLAALRKPSPAAPSATRNGLAWPGVLILVPGRDEEAVIGGLCEALAGLDYPPGRVQVALIDDGSQDATRAVMSRFAQGKPGWHVVSLPNNVGKASALNRVLEQIPFGDIVYIFDADHRPRPDVLRRAVRYFDDPCVAGVSGLTVASNALASPSAYYASVENDVHRLITMRAKDRLDLAPAVLGSNCGYRRAALAQWGGFPAGALLEDTDLTLALYRAGYTIRFAEDAIAYHQAPETVDAYLKQHRRWARGFNDAAGRHASAVAGNRSLSWPLRVELMLFSAGYLDRFALMGAGLLSVLSWLAPAAFGFPRAVLGLALVMPFVQVAALFAAQQAPKAMWMRFPLIPLFFGLDLLAAASGMSDTLLRRARTWSRTARSRGRAKAGTLS